MQYLQCCSYVIMLYILHRYILYIRPSIRLKILMKSSIPKYLVLLLYGSSIRSDVPFQFGNWDGFRVNVVVTVYTIVLIVVILSIASACSAGLRDWNWKLCLVAFVH